MPPCEVDQRLLHEPMLQHAKSDPDSVAVVDGNTNAGITYSSLELMTRVVGGELAKQVGGGKWYWTNGVNGHDQPV